jgi:hypothetical protein
MKKVLLATTVFLALALTVAQADECQIHTAYATSGTVTVSTAAGTSAQNGVVGYAFFNAFPCTTTGVAYIVKASDPSTANYYGFALVGVNGGATPGFQYATTGGVDGPVFSGTNVLNGDVLRSLPWSGGPVQNLPVGIYMLVLGTTCSSACALLWGDASVGQFYPFIYADTSPTTPWTFSSAGFSGFSSSTTPAVSIDLSTNATQNISGTTATVTLNSILIGHIYVGATISVQGVTTAGATALNCTSCRVTAVVPSTATVSYTLPSSATFLGTVCDGATLSVSPVIVGETGSGCSNKASPCIVAPTALIY